MTDGATAAVTAQMPMVGAHVCEDPAGVHFRVWAARRQQVTVELCRPEPGKTLGSGEVRRFRMEREAGGYFAAHVAPAQPGDLYRFVLDDHLRRPDPASHFQPLGVHEWSQVTNPKRYAWNDAAWRGIHRDDLVIYELHVGTFTEAGTYAAAVERISELLALGVTAIELMPLAQCPGGWNWGYDGVYWYAPNHAYGTPDDLRAMVDAFHQAGIAVLLDVVYNHLGPEGNYLNDFAPYFSLRHRTPWGPALGYDGKYARHVRHFVISNAVYWLQQFHFDGLRLDAVHFMYDGSRVPICDELSLTVQHLGQSLGRPLLLIGESNVFDRQLLGHDHAAPSVISPTDAKHSQWSVTEGTPSVTEQATDTRHASRRIPARGFDAIWCDDLMHAIIRTAHHGKQLSHRHYDGAADVAEVLHHGYLYELVTQGRPYRRASRDDRHMIDDLSCLVAGIQNHDTIGNHPQGERLAQGTSLDFQRAAAALMLLYPTLPILFMGEEFASPAPFLFFVDFQDNHLREAVVRGRAREYAQHDWSNAVSPLSLAAFEASRRGEIRDGDQATWTWYQMLIALRKSWRNASLLTTNQLSVASDVAKGVFVLQYTRTEPDRSRRGAFVVVRLNAHNSLSNAAKIGNATKCSERTVTLGILPDSELVADSRQPNAADSDGWDAAELRSTGGSTLTLHENHAVVGNGFVDPEQQLDWRTVERTIR